jgi:hypothetical protein
MGLTANAFSRLDKGVIVARQKAIRSIGGGWGEVMADRLGETECSP